MIEQIGMDTGVLHEAARLGKLDEVRRLIEVEGFKVDAPGKSTATALHLAVGQLSSLYYDVRYA